MFILVMFATAPNHWIILVLVAMITVSMFLPIKFVHPVRTERFRNITLPMAIAWVGFAIWAAWGNFNVHPIANIGLIVTSIYLLCVGFVQQMTED